MKTNDLQRLKNLHISDANKIRARQKSGTMGEYFDEEGYLCFSISEYNSWQPKKTGRKAILGRR